MLASDVLGWDLTITTGLSAKNLVIYLVAVFLALRMVVGRSSVMAAGPMQVAFLVQIAYAIFTWMLAGLVIKYQGYDFIASAIRLKAGLIDFYIFFLVFLFGVRNAADGLKVIKWLLVGAVFANLCTLLDTVGLVDLGFKEKNDGRAQGALGESNQYAAYIILFVPGMIAAAVASRGLMRLAWLAGALLSCFVLVTTGSRGGIVGALLACMVGAYLYRHLVSSRVAGWALGSLLVFGIVLSFSQYGGLLSERMIGQTTNIDVVEATSGRSEAWLNMFLTMLRVPITFITGFGWDVYWSFPFRFSPHNHYFSLWFNLGLVGILTGSYLLFSAIGRARRASMVADPATRRHLIAFVIGATGVCGAVFFVQPHLPWIFFWMYTGTVMRLVLCTDTPTVPVAVPQRRGPARISRDNYGWASAAGRKSP